MSENTFSVGVGDSIGACMVVIVLILACVATWGSPDIIDGIVARLLVCRP